MTEAEDKRRQRKELKQRYAVAYERVSDILFTGRPVAINFEDNTDEYTPDVDTILPRLRDCRSADDVRRIVHEELVKWFDVVTAGPPEKYQTVAKRIWEEVVPGLTGSMRGRTTRWTWRVGLSLAAQRAYRLRQADSQASTSVSRKLI
jgi:hypothetical protein